MAKIQATTSASPSTADEMKARLHQLDVALSSTKEQLRRALLDGGDTASTRAQLLELETERETTATRLANLERRAELERQQPRRDAVEAAAHEHARRAQARLQQRLTALQPPLFPTTSPKN